MHSSGFFSDKAYCKVDFKCKILGSHTISDQSLLLSTVVLNDSISYLMIKIICRKQMQTLTDEGKWWHLKKVLATLKKLLKQNVWLNVADQQKSFILMYGVIYNYFIKKAVEKKALCQLCNREYVYLGILLIRDHLLHFHSKA